MSKPFYILSVDGGGFRGLFAAHLLKKMEEAWRIDWGCRFGLLAGTSTGSILTAGPQPGLMIHSDRGIQYCCDGFRKAVDAHQFVQSMSKKADCWDNAVSESFFKTLKTEWLYHVDLTDLDHAERELFEYIEMFYNNQRLHAYLDYVSPALFERLSLQKAA